MAYCPKCGIQVERDNRPCPLCSFPIPKINESDETAVSKFPKAANPYPMRFRRVLNRIFIFVSLLIFVAISLMFYIDYELNQAFTWARYSNLSVLAGWGILYFSFGYVRSYYIIITGSAIISLILLFGLDIFSGNLNWFIPLAFPIVVGTAVIGLCYCTLIRFLSVRRFNIIGFFFIAVVVLSMWINLFISIYRGDVDLSKWLISTGLQVLPITLVIIYVKYGLPTRIKQQLARKFHL